MEQILVMAEENIGWVIFGFFVFAVGLASVEFLVEWHKKKLTKWRLGEMLSSLMVFVPAQLTEKASTALLFGAYFFIYQFIPWQIPVNVWTILLAILLVDFLYYWEHRWEHEIRLLWTYHSIHHSSPVYNYTTALRVSFIDNFVSWIFFLPAVIMGFHPLIVGLAMVFILTYQFWLHTELIKRMGRFEKIFNSPSLHRVHHGSDELYLDKNYGGMLIIWDRMFGTFQEEVFRPTYGLTKQLNSINPVTVHFKEFADIGRDVRQAENFEEVLGYVFNKPGWKPKRHLKSTST